MGGIHNLMEHHGNSITPSTVRVGESRKSSPADVEVSERVDVNASSKS